MLVEGLIIIVMLVVCMAAVVKVFRDNDDSFE